jgi:hypothetical protein
VEESGRIMDSIIIDRRSYLTSPSQTPHSMDYILLHIILTEGLIFYVISYNPLHHISSVSSLGGDFLFLGGGVLKWWDLTTLELRGNNTIHE